MACPLLQTRRGRTPALTRWQHTRCGLSNQSDPSLSGWRSQRRRAQRDAPSPNWSRWVEPVPSVEWLYMYLSVYICCQFMQQEWWEINLLNIQAKFFRGSCGLLSMYVVNCIVSGRSLPLPHHWCCCRCSSLCPHTSGSTLRSSTRYRTATMRSMTSPTLRGT